MLNCLIIFAYVVFNGTVCSLLTGPEPEALFIIITSKSSCLCPCDEPPPKQQQNKQNQPNNNSNSGLIFKHVITEQNVIHQRERERELGGGTIVSTDGIYLVAW